MKGKVLGFDAASGTGAINGEDNQRYAFTAADFKSPGPAKPNDSVDFRAEAGAAKDIYVTAASMPNVDLGALTSNATVASIMAKPSVIWAAIVILGSLIAGYLTNSFTMMQLAGGMGFLFILLFLLPILAGGLIYLELTNHAMTAQARMITGGAAIALPILIPLVVGGGGMGGMGGFFGGLGAGGFADFFGFNITIGKILTVGGGVLILLTHFGIIKKLG